MCADFYEGRIATLLLRGVNTAFNYLQGTTWASGSLLSGANPSSEEA